MKVAPPLSILPSGGVLIRLRLNALNKENSMRTKKEKASARLKVYLAPDQYAAIVESATNTGLSMSAFARKCCLGSKVEPVMNAGAVRDLIKINADMGRLGGLLKLYLTMPEVPATDVLPLLKEIKDIKDIMEKKILEL